MKNISLNRQPDMYSIKESLTSMIDEILSNNSVLLNLTDIKTNDDYTFLHSVNVTTISLVIGKLLQYDKRKLIELGIGALLHDIGKAFIPSEILNKPGKLTNEEFEIMKKHPLLGYKCLKENREISENSKLAIVTHHEKVNGTGYPYNLGSNNIHQFGKIIAVADVFDALVSDRIYRKKWPIYQAREYLMSQTNIQFDNDIIRTFMQNIAAFPNGTIVKLSTGESGIVINQNKNFPERPIIKVFKDSNGHLVDKIVNLIQELSIVIIDSEL